MAFSFPFVSFSNVKFPCNTAHHSSTSSFLAPTSSHFVSPLRQVCHMSCVHFGLTRMCPTSSGGTLDSRFSFLVSGFCTLYSVFSIQEEAMPGQEIVLKCVSQQFPPSSSSVLYSPTAAPPFPHPPRRPSSAVCIFAK